MVENVHLLSSVKNEMLDEYLSYGWYRMGNMIFTTNILEPHATGEKYRVFWLRYIVENVKHDSKNLKLLYRNREFKVTYRRFSLTPEVIDLHKAYYQSLDFNTTNNLKDLLQDTDNEVYDTYLVEVRDDGKLIAGGVFDRGTNSIAGIINFYDPAYKKYSPGKFLMLMKYQFCKDHNIYYYYPGYYSPEYPVFDYKLFIDKNATEVFIPGVQIWIPYSEFCKICGIFL